MYPYPAVNTILVNNDANRNMLNVTSKSTSYHNGFVSVKDGIREKGSDDKIESMCNL